MGSVFAIPLSVVADAVIHSYSLPFLSYCGALLIALGFILLNFALEDSLLSDMQCSRRSLSRRCSQLWQCCRPFSQNTLHLEEERLSHDENSEDEEHEPIRRRHDRSPDPPSSPRVVLVSSKTLTISLQSFPSSPPAVPLSPRGGGSSSSPSSSAPAALLENARANQTRPADSSSSSGQSAQPPLQQEQHSPPPDDHHHDLTVSRERSHAREDDADRQQQQSHPFFLYLTQTSYRDSFSPLISDHDSQTERGLSRLSGLFSFLQPGTGRFILITIIVYVCLIVVLFLSAWATQIKKHEFK